MTTATYRLPGTAEVLAEKIRIRELRVKHARGEDRKHELEVLAQLRRPEAELEQRVERLETQMDELAWYLKALTRSIYGERFDPGNWADSPLVWHEELIDDNGNAFRPDDDDPDEPFLYGHWKWGEKYDEEEEVADAG